MTKIIRNSIPTSQKGQVNGVASLDASGIVPISQLPTSLGAEAVGEAFNTDFIALEAGGGDLTAYTETGAGGNFSLFSGQGLDVRAETSINWNLGLQYTPYISNGDGLCWTTTFKVKNVDASTRGVGFSLQSVNSVLARQNSLHWYLTQNAGGEGFIALYKNKEILPMQTSLFDIPVSNNDEFEMEAMFDGDSLYIAYTNLTTGNFEKTSLTHKFSFSRPISWNGVTNTPDALSNPFEGKRLLVTDGSSSTVLDRLGASLSYSIGDYLIYESGGWANKGDSWAAVTPNTYTPTVNGVQTHSVAARVAFVTTSALTRLVKKNPDVLFIGDSITKGYWSDSYESSFVERIKRRARDISVANYSQPSALTTSFVSPSIDEVIEINPTHVIYIAGSNDAEEGETNADIYARMDAQRVLLEAAGITFHYAALLPRDGIAAIKSYNDYVITQLGGYPANYLDLYYPFRDPGTSDGILSEYSDDGVHLSADGARVASDVVLKYLFDKGIAKVFNRV